MLQPELTRQRYSKKNKNKNKKKELRNNVDNF
jgi:hypothetical protein